MSIFNTRNSTRPAATGDTFRVRQTISRDKMIMWRWLGLIREAARPIRLPRLPTEIAQ